jgi:hypothetical protein
MKVDRGDQRSLALWAAGCAGHVLRCFEEAYPQDDRPRNAVEAAHAWARDEIRVGEARFAAVAAHAAARAAGDAAARAAARAAGHAAGTAHMAGHVPHAAACAATAAGLRADAATTAAAAAADAASAAAADDAAPTDPEGATAAARDAEHAWQVERLPEHLRPLVFPTRDGG